MPAANKPANWHEQHRILTADGWRRGNDGLWRNDRFGGSYKTANAMKRIGSVRGEITQGDPVAGQLRWLEGGVKQITSWGPFPFLRHLSAELDRRPRGRIERQDRVVEAAIARLPERAGRIATGIWIIISMDARRQSFGRMLERLAQRFNSGQCQRGETR